MSDWGWTPGDASAEISFDGVTFDGLRTLRASEVRRERIDWLWPGRIAYGSVNALVGDPGLGKSLLTCKLAADVAPETTLMVTAEDSLAATVRPRLEAAGADLDAVRFVQMWRDGLEDGLRLPDDVDALQQAVAEHGARLVVIDPLVAHLPESVNSWRDQSVRRALAPLRRLAETHGCAVVIVVHLNKGQAATTLYRVGGSIGVVGAVRSALLLARDPDDPEGEQGNLRVAAQIKSNLAAAVPSVALAVEPILIPAAGDDPEVETARIVELGESAHDGSDLLRRGDDEERSALDEATEFLGEELGPGPRAAKDVLRDGRAAGHAEKTLRRAAKQLAVKKTKTGFGGGWEWALPAPREDGQGGWPPSQDTEDGQLGHLLDEPLEHGVSGAATDPGKVEGGQYRDIGIFGAESARNGSPPWPIVGDELYPLVLADAVRDGRLTFDEAEERYALHEAVVVAATR